MKRLLVYIGLFVLWIALFVGFLVVINGSWLFTLPLWAKAVCFLVGSGVFGWLEWKLIYYILDNPVYISKQKRKEK